MKTIDRNNEIQLLIIKSIFKGVAHATIVPLLVMMLVNANFVGNFGILAGSFYLLVPSLVYLYAKNKDISKMFFFGTLKFLGIFSFLVATLLLGLIA